MEKPICVVVLHDNSLTSNPTANRRSRIGVCLLFAKVMGWGFPRPGPYFSV